MSLTNEQKIKLDEIFDRANITQETRDFWISRLEKVKKDLFEVILEFFCTNPGIISDCEDVQIKKEEAFASGNRNVWKEIIEEEKDKLTRFLESSEK